MYFIQVGLHYSTNDVTVREQYVIHEDDLPEVNRQINDHSSVYENVIISTCNRTEVYAVVSDPIQGYDAVFSTLHRIFRDEANKIQDIFSCKQDHEAIEHLLRVTAGLDSMIVGETEILGQVKQAFFIAQRAGTTKKWCHEIFKRAITVGKRVQSQMKQGASITSVSHFASLYIRRKLKNIHQPKVIVVGAGTIGEGLVQSLSSGGDFQVTIANRTMEKAKSLADKYGMTSISLDQLQAHITNAHAVILAVRHDEYVLTKAALSQLGARYLEEALYIVDLGVPRNVDPNIDTINWVRRIDMDDIQVEMNEVNRIHSFAYKQAEKIIQGMQEEIREWMTLLPVHEHLALLDNKGRQVKGAIMQSIENKIPTLTKREKGVIDKHMQSMVNQLLGGPLRYIKKQQLENNPILIEDVVEMFQLELEEVRNQEQENLRKQQDSC